MTNQELHPTPETDSRFFYGYIVVAAASLIMLFNYGTRISFGVFFKPMLADFGWTRALTSGAFTLSMLVQGVGAIIMGRLTDRLGPKFVMTLCGFFLGTGYLLMSLINGTWQLYLVYGVIIGIGMGGSFVALLSTIARWFVKRRGMMTGVVVAGLGIGTIIVPPISNWLISIYDWRMSYIITGGAVLVLSILAAQFLKRDPTRMKLVPYGENRGEKQGLDLDTAGLSLKEAVNTRQFWLVMLTYFCMGYGIFAIIVHLVPHITDLGISATTAVNVLAVTGALNIVGCIVLGSAIDRIGNRRVITISLILIAAGAFWLVPVTEVWMLYLFAIVYGTGAGGGGPVESTVTAELFGMKSHGSILGFISFSFTVGGAAGPFLTGYLFDVTGDYQSAFLITAFVTIAGIIFTALLQPLKK